MGQRKIFFERIYYSPLFSYIRTIVFSFHSGLPELEQVQVLILYHIYMYLEYFTCNCTSPKPFSKNIYYLSEPILFAPFQPLNYYHTIICVFDLQKSNFIPPSIPQHNPKRERCLEKLLIFDKVRSMVFEIVESESTNGLSKL